MKANRAEDSSLRRKEEEEKKFRRDLHLKLEKKNVDFFFHFLSGIQSFFNVFFFLFLMFHISLGSRLLQERVVWVSHIENVFLIELSR